MMPISTSVPALDKVIKILDFLTLQPGSTFSHIYQGTSLPKSSTSSLLSSMVKHGLLRQENDKFYLGLKLYELGNHALEKFDIKTLAIPALTRLRDETHLTCHLGVLEGTAAIYLAKLESPEAIVVRSWIGKKLSLYSSGLGKALMAWLPETEIDLLLEGEKFITHTSTTISNKEDLKKELRQIHDRGWSYDNEEDSIGVRCIAAPIFNKQQKAIAAISVSGVTFQVPEEKHSWLAQLVQQAAQSVSDALK
ncbi:IclR family transcriptional regulator [Neisseria sp. Ec49-e6-T10]|uniref:IclR family transcriptional regulator n=1 Tax=Neisseria sp. Ec49-e6-T10 TaxID=3140744 RepID=UPI003EB6AFD3